jgi:hypothetical protein
MERWHKARQSIIHFVEKVTKEGSAEFVAVADRIATFDNDGTLWCEQPIPIQLDFILRRWVEMALLLADKLRILRSHLP